ATARETSRKPSAPRTTASRFPSTASSRSSSSRRLSAPSAHSSTVESRCDHLKIPTLTTQIVAGLALGVLVGAVWPSPGVAFKPGAGRAVRLAGDTATVEVFARNQQTAWDMFLHLFPTSVVDAMARGDILQVVVFSMFFGAALSAMGEHGKPVVAVLDSLAHVMFKVTSYVMAFAPLGVFAAIASTVGGRGITILVSLGKLVALMYIGLAIFVV